jgi:hypothetical protein
MLFLTLVTNAHRLLYSRDCDRQPAEVVQLGFVFVSTYIVFKGAVLFEFIGIFSPLFCLKQDFDEMTCVNLTCMAQNRDISVRFFLLFLCFKRQNVKTENYK